MTLALYCPECGYYETERDTTGHRGDFYTSVSVGPVFGALLAFQFAAWLQIEATIQNSVVTIVEAGAHDGRLARDILTWLKKRRPALFARTEYCIVEPSARRRAWQMESLHDLTPRVHWFADLRSLGQSAAAGLRGIFFSNELLDALPVHRLGWDAKRRAWFEWGVTLVHEHFVWTRLEDYPPQRSADCLPGTIAWAALPALRDLPPGLLDVLPDGYTTEVCPAAADWWHEAASVLHRGKLLTLDYGLTTEEFFAPQRRNGTLRAYRNHQVSGDVLDCPGGQDLTAHVDFTAIQQAGVAAGLNTEALFSQARFLTAIAQDAWQAENDFGPWTPEHTRQFQTLTHPNHLGRAFQVLIQSRGDCSS